MGAGRFYSKSKKKYKPDLHKISKSKYKKAAGKAKKIGKSNKEIEKNLILIGMWLHTRQDRWTHGLKSQKIKHKSKTDNYLYDFNWKTKKFSKKFGKIDTTLEEISLRAVGMHHSLML